MLLIAFSNLMRSISKSLPQERQTILQTQRSRSRFSKRSSKAVWASSSKQTACSNRNMSRLKTRNPLQSTSQIPARHSAAPSRLQTSSATKRAKVSRREKKTLLLKSKRWSTTSNFFGNVSVNRHSVTAVPIFLKILLKIPKKFTEICLQIFNFIVKYRVESRMCRNGHPDMKNYIVEVFPL